MLFRYDYLKSLEAQCDYIYPQRNLKQVKTVFCDVCRNLNRDFLPPIDRKDIAAVSYSLVDIASKINNKDYPDEIKKQLVSLKSIIKSMFEKSKTCGEDIRRLIEINIEFKSNDADSRILNDALSDFLKTVLCAYFGNL